MNNKRGVADHLQSFRPPTKRSRYLDQNSHHYLPQHLNVTHYYDPHSGYSRYSRDQTSAYDPAHHFEQLSISRDRLAPSPGTTQNMSGTYPKEITSPAQLERLTLFYKEEIPTVADSAPPPSGPRQAKSKSKASKRSKPKSKKKCKKLLPVIAHDDKQIDIVLDTNILLSFLHFLRAVIPLLSSTCRILVPQAVLLELDMQKNRQKPVDVYEAGKEAAQIPMGSLARKATNWLLSTTRSHPSNVIIQKIAEEEEDNKRKHADTRILSFAQKLFDMAKSQHTGAVTVLLSNDNTLRLRAQSEGICSLRMSDFHHSPRQMMSAIRNFVPYTSVPTIPALGASSSSLCPAAAEKSKLKEKSKAPPARSWVPSEKDAAFTFTSLLPNISKCDDSAAVTEPGQELNRLRSDINKPRRCMGCQSDVQSTLQVSPDKLHHYCPMCCEVICRGCMRETRCEWACSGPFYGEVCATMKCCAKGRAAILLELLCQLDGNSLANQHKLTFKDGANITHLYGDEALTKYLQATTALLVTSKGDEPDFVESILISSTLLDVLSQTLLSSPFLKWHFRSEVFMSAIKLIKTVFQSLPRPWKILNSEYTKKSTPKAKLTPSTQAQKKVEWNRVIEASHQPNATSVKVDRLRESFPSLMADVKDVLRNRPGSSSTMIQKLLDSAARVPLCYILEKLFEASMKTKKKTSSSPSSDGISDEMAQLTQALLDLKNVYESNIESHTSDSNTKSKVDHHKRNSVDSTDDQDSDHLAGKAESTGRVNLNHKVDSRVKGRAGDDTEVEPGDDVTCNRNTDSHRQEVDGKGNVAKLKGTSVGETKRAMEAREKNAKPTCSVKRFFDQIDALSIASGQSSGSDIDEIEIIHLN